MGNMLFTTAQAVEYLVYLRAGQSEPVPTSAPWSLDSQSKPVPSTS